MHTEVKSSNVVVSPASSQLRSRRPARRPVLRPRRFCVRGTAVRGSAAAGAPQEAAEARRVRQTVEVCFHRPIFRALVHRADAAAGQAADRTNRPGGRAILERANQPCHATEGGKDK